MSRPSCDYWTSSERVETTRQYIEIPPDVRGWQRYLGVDCLDHARSPLSNCSRIAQMQAWRGRDGLGGHHRGVSIHESLQFIPLPGLQPGEKHLPTGIVQFTHDVAQIILEGQEFFAEVMARGKGPPHSQQR